MTNGFGGKENIKVSVQEEELNKLLKKYKGIRKYMKSPLYQVKVMDGTENVVSELVEEYNNDPIEL
jgi:predicted phage tail protein